MLCRQSEEFTGLSIDSRTVRSGEIFLALKGPHFDGHDFLHDALRTGAGAIVEITPAGATSGKTIIQTESSLAALQSVARYLRNRSGVPAVGITGTNGKTTTKELIASIMGRKFRVLKTSGNLNNHIGLPLSIANGAGDEDVMVLEMGSNVKGDIKLLCQIARPDVAVVTNVGPAHLEGFGSLEMVRKTDLEILEYVGAVALNADDPFLMEGVEEFKGKIITFGIKSAADVTARDIVLGDKGSHFSLRLPGGIEGVVRLEIPGMLNVYNSLAAAAAALLLGANAAEIREGLGLFQGVPMRLEVLEHCGATVISDVYNANPASMEEAVKELLRLKRKRTIAVLGDMLELGRHSGEAHRKLVGLLSETGVDILIAVGPEMISAATGFAGTRYLADDSIRAASILAEILGAEDTVLVKGSRGMRMERVLSPSGERRTTEKSHAI